ncbi:MATE family efflux transporter [Anabaena cylindrica UHCC 0172]|uniref:MATE family efflux transporter n=1 Tax=Anabaena cylindrica TaxID=1165 RepID=UPI002B1F6FB8|nr:MATE family efflux transporter [Anabaena cylindrica]MEA5554200.1 MATE family efflux transporter [Anabaena cylindrica UHCC 0172]
MCLNKPRVVDLMRSPSKILSEVFATLQLAVPLGGIQLAETAVGFVNTVMMGFLGIQSLAAGALGVITFYTITFMCMGVLEGASPLAAEAFGAGNTKRIRQLLAQGLWLVLALSLPMMLLTWHLDYILMLSGQQENTVALASHYLRAIVWGFPAVLGFFIFKEVATALNRPQLISAIALTSIPLNITINYLLLFGKLGLPSLGLAGIGWASTFVLWVNCLTAAAILGFHPWFREYKLFSSLRFNRELFAELWENGWPIGLQFAASMLLFTLIALFSGYMGTTLLAANEIVVQTIEVSLIVPIATSYAAMTRVGQMLGQNDFTGAKRSGFAAITIGIATMSIITIALWLFPEQIAGIYLDASHPDNAIAIKSAIPLLRIAALFLIAYGLNFIAMGLLQGIQDIRFPLLINILFQWCVGITSGYLLCFYLNWGGIGLWSGLTIGTTLATVFLIYRFYLLTSEIIQSKEDEEGCKSADDDQTPVLQSVS